MPNPKKRTSAQKRNSRRSHHRLIPVERNLCTNCQEPKMLHRVCSHCGYYKGRQAIKIDSE